MHALWTDEKLRRFFQRYGVQGVPKRETVDFYLHDDLEGACYDMSDYAEKLMSGEEKISQTDRSANVLAAKQLRKLFEKFGYSLECIKPYAL